MFVYAFKLDDKLQQKILDQLDFGKGPKFDWEDGQRQGGFLMKDDRGYVFVRGAETN